MNPDPTQTPNSGNQDRQDPALPNGSSQSTVLNRLATQTFSPQQPMSVENNTQEALTQPSTTPDSSKQYSLSRKVKRVGYVFWGLFIPFLVAVGWISYSENHGRPNAGFAGFALLPFEPILFVLGITYWVLLIRYIFSPYTRSKQKLLSGVVVVLFVVIPTVVIVLAVQQSNINNTKYNHQEALANAQQQQYNKITTPQAISITEATSLINQCKISQFYDVSDGLSQENPSNSSTDIYLISLPKTGPYRITTISTIGTQLTPVVQAAEVKCGGIPYFNSDN